MKTISAVKKTDSRIKGWTYGGKEFTNETDLIRHVMTLGVLNLGDIICRITDDGGLYDDGGVWLGQPDFDNFITFDKTSVVVVTCDGRIGLSQINHGDHLGPVYQINMTRLLDKTIFMCLDHGKPMIAGKSLRGNEISVYGKVCAYNDKCVLRQTSYSAIKYIIGIRDIVVFEF